MAASYPPAVEAVWSAYPKPAKGKIGNKSEFAKKWQRLGLTDDDQERVLQLLSENPPDVGVSATAWLGQVIANETPRKPKPVPVSEPVSVPEPAAKHAGGRPRKPGMQRLTMSLPERTVRALKILSSVNNVTTSDLIVAWTEAALDARPDIKNLIE